MNIHQLREAQVSFENRMDEVIQAREPLHQLRERFIQYFTPALIKRMEIEDYAAGFGKPTNGYNFCYTLERQLDGLGRLLGSPAPRYGIYYSQEHEQLMVTKKWGTDADKVFAKIKDAIIDLIEAGKLSDFSKIADNPLSKMFKGKILSTYFPEKYLNVFSKDHLNYFLIQFNLDTQQLIKADPIYKKKTLVDYKNNDAIMRHWSLDMFQYFLYNYYPGRPPKDDQPPNDPLADYRLPNFPPNPTPSVVDLDIIPLAPTQPGTGRKGGSANPDYEAEARKQKRLGDRGEKIVLDMERKRLTDAGKPKLAAQVKKADFDYEGYDIRSFETDGTPRYIEVKATRANVGKANFFLSANELKKASELNNYHVYMVFEILKPQPKVWMIGNPFHPENANVIKQPVSYRVTINAQRS